MRRKIKVILSLVIVLTIIFIMGTITIAEVVEVSKSESESPKTEAPKDEPKESSEPEAPALPEVPLIPEEEIEEIVLAEPILMVYYLSMNAEVIPEKEKFINGEDLTCKIKISNDGDLDLYNISVVDDLDLEDTISILSPGEEMVMNGSYSN